MNKRTAKKKRITLEMIWEDLQKQKIESEKSQWLTPMGFAGSIVAAGIVLMLPAKDIGFLIYGIVLFAFVFCMYIRTSRKLK